MSTRVLAQFGVHRLRPNQVADILARANRFRRILCRVYQARHDREIRIRNEFFPEILRAMSEYEALGYRCWELDTEIKKHHSDVRNRNAVLQEQKVTLKALRRQHAIAKDRVKVLRLPWFAAQKEFEKRYAAAADWKNVKTLSRRIQLYRRMDLEGLSPAAYRYGQMFLASDIREKYLGVIYQGRGLHSAIRGEIVKASQPKKKRTGPGMRYHYRQRPEPKVWEKISIAFLKGLTLTQLLTGVPGLRISRVTAGYATVRQQIGTEEHPRMIEYPIRIHRDFPPDTQLQRWTLCVRTENVLVVTKNNPRPKLCPRYRATVLPIMQSETFEKPKGTGLLTYELSWLPGLRGVTVATFRGDHVHETLVLPQALVDRRMQFKVIQQDCDDRCNTFLTEHGATPQPGERQGYMALIDWCRRHINDNEAANLYDVCTIRLGVALRDRRQSIRCIVKLYEGVVLRVCREHGVVVHEDKDHAKDKRYDTRDLLKQNAPTQSSRELRAAVAPGKLKQLLEGYGLVTREEIPADFTGIARNTDLFTSYVAAAGVGQAVEV